MSATDNLEKVERSTVLLASDAGVDRGLEQELVLPDPDVVQQLERALVVLRDRGIVMIIRIVLYMDFA